MSHLFFTAGSSMVMLFWSFCAFSQQELKPVESILDRLEKRLLDEEGQPLTFEEQSAKKSKAAKPDDKGEENEVTQHINAPAASIEAEPEQLRNVRDLAQSINEIETQVEQLESEVIRTKQKVLEESQIKNHITLDALLTKPELASLKSLNVRIDGFEVYQIKETGGLWLPSSRLPLYSGPMQPGQHRIDMEATLVNRNREGLPLNNGIQRFISQSFDFQVTDGKQSSRLSIHMDAPADLNEKPTATLKAEQP